MSHPIIPVLLAGGGGSRLWPLSRKSHPKQFYTLFDKRSLLQNTAIRARELAADQPLVIVTNEQYYFLCKDQMSDLGLSNVVYLLEPTSRNTAPAIALAALYVQQQINPQATLLILPSDHYIDDNKALQQTILTAKTCCDANKLVIFGITPQSPKTGYGYIKIDTAFNSHSFHVQQFVEKPSLNKAQHYLDQGGYYWNSGIFLFNAASYLQELNHCAPDIYQQCTHAYQNTQLSTHQDFVRIDKSFADCRSSSIDYEIMEKTSNAVLTILNISWSDLGCWASVAESAESDSQGNVTRGNVLVSKSENCLISSERRRVIAIGLHNQIVVSTPDAVLVADKQYSQDVKNMVETLKAHKDSVATEHLRTYRPWGHFERLSHGPNYQVKYIFVKPDASLSLQLHHHRSEHWVVVSGTASVRNGEDNFILKPNQSTYIEKNTKHQLSNSQNEPLIVIEVQSGSYLGEDDIVRFDDAYGRAETAAKVN